MIRTRSSSSAILLLASGLGSQASAQCAIQGLHSGLGSDPLHIGHSIALDLDRLATCDDVAHVVVFERELQIWHESQVLEMPGWLQGSGFGRSLALDGDWMCVGNPASRVPGVTDGGAVLFVRAGGVWMPRQPLQSQPFPGVTSFGLALALDGDLLVVGAQPADALVFRFDGEQWTFEAELEGGQIPFDGFGGTLAIDAAARRIAVGAIHDAQAGEEAGTVHLFREVAGVWTHEAELRASATDEEDEFGVALALEGDRLLVSAHKAGVHGRAYLFERIADAWVETTTFAPPVGLDGFDGFGRSVSLSGDRAAVAWPGSEVDGVLLAGSAFVYREGAGGWELDVRVLPSVVGIGYLFGWEMAFAGETLIAAYSEPSSLLVYAVSQAVELACACDGSAPCGNEFGAAGCRVLAHEGARLSACGSASLAADDLVLEVSRVPANQSGLVFLAQPGPTMPFGDGILCVAPSGPGPFRYPLQTSNSGGSFELGPGIGEYARDHFPTTGWMLPGSTWSFQGWFRAPAGPCGTGFGLTNALLVTFGA